MYEVCLLELVTHIIWHATWTLPHLSPWTTSFAWLTKLNTHLFKLKICFISQCLYYGQVMVIAIFKIIRMDLCKHFVQSAQGVHVREGAFTPVKPLSARFIKRCLDLSYYVHVFDCSPHVCCSQASWLQMIFPPPPKKKKKKKK